MTIEEKWQRRLAREQAARQQAEKLLEEKSLQLYEKNEALKQARDKLEELVEIRTAEVRRLSMVASKSTCGVVITDSRGCTEWVNEGFTNITGYSPEEVIGKVPGHLLQGPGSNPETIQRMSRRIAACEPFTEEILNFRKDGTPYWIRLDVTPLFNGGGDPEGFISIQTDLTARKHAEERMGLLTQALEQSSEGFALTEANGLFTYLNEAHVKIFGYQRAGEMIGKSWEILYTREEVERVKREVFPVLVKCGTWRGIATGRRKDGSEFPEDLSLKLLEDGRIICACRDDTERVRAEKRLKDAIDEANTLNKELGRAVDDLDAYAHSVAHDLKNPLFGIIGIAEILHSDWDSLPDRTKLDFINDLLESGQGMNSIIQELLLLASVRQGAVRVERVDPQQCLESVRRRLKFLIQRTGTELATEHPFYPFLGHTPWIEGVLSNYLSNAIKYGGKPPRIRIGMSRLDGGLVQLWVDDNGAGVPEQSRSLIFEKHTRGEVGEKEGHGIGLAIVKRIIENLNGETGVCDAPSGGARFFFNLPCARTDSQPEYS